MNPKHERPPLDLDLGADDAAWKACDEERLELRRLLTAETQRADLLQTAYNAEVQRADAAERELDEARIKVMVYETDDGVSAYSAGKSFMRGQLEPQLVELQAKLTAAEQALRHAVYRAHDPAPTACEGCAQVARALGDAPEAEE